MSRDLALALQQEFSAAELRPIYLIEMLFDTGAVRLWSGIGELQWGGYTWYGSGTVLQVTAISETSEVKANGVNISLSGIGPEIIGIALAEDYQGRTAKIYIGAVNISMELIADPVAVFIGRMDVMRIEQGGEAVRVELSVENVLIDLSRARKRLYTSQDQAIDYPGDKGFDFVPILQEKDIKWGRA